MDPNGGEIDSSQFGVCNCGIPQQSIALNARHDVLNRKVALDGHCAVRDGYSIGNSGNLHSYLFHKLKNCF